MHKFRMLLVAAALGFASTAEASGLSPKGDWKIGPIEAKAQDGRGYCSMKSAYDEGHSLVFARDALGSNSIAIEFPKANLENGKQYPLHLVIGQIERDVTALAAGAKLLVMQMGDDDVFYEMLARKKELSVKSDAGQFSFNLKGTSKALMALDNCAAAFTGGKPPKSVKMGLPPVFSGLDEGGFEPPITSGYASGLGDGQTIIRVTQPKPFADEEVMLDEAGDDENENASIEIQKLKAENRALELENQATAQRLKAAELAKKQKDTEAAADFAERERKLKAENEKLQSALEAARKSVKAKGKEKPSSAKQETRIQDMMARAGITEALPYSWEVSGVYGAAEEYAWPAGKSFRAVAEQYIAEMRDKCMGDFAYTLGDIKKSGPSETAEAEIACIGGDTDAAAALLFVADGGKLVAITHEGPAEQMSAALEKRAQILASLE